MPKSGMLKRVLMSTVSVLPSLSINPWSADYLFHRIVQLKKVVEIKNMSWIDGYTESIKCRNKER